MPSRSAEFVIIGSGPTGCAYARQIRADWPEARILMVEAGPYLREIKGAHLDNIADPAERTRAEIGAQGPFRAPYEPMTEAEWNARRAGGFDASLLRRQGLFLANPDDVRDNSIFAGFSAANVGGMATKWTTGCPRPARAELPPFIPAAEMDAALDAAEALLKVNKDLHPNDPVASALRDRLGAAFNPGRSPDRVVQPMPLASTPTGNGTFLRHGIEVILGDMFDEPAERFELLAETACRRILHENGVATGVELVPTAGGDPFTVTAGAVIVAADSLHGPQLLYASGIRPWALGRHLNDHYQVTILAEMDEPTQMQSMSWIPRIDEWTFSVTVGPSSVQSLPFKVDLTGQPVGMGVFVASDVVPENRLIFDDSRTDWLGLPAISIAARRTEADLARIEEGKALVLKIANLIGRPAPGFTPVHLPMGSSLHYQGTLRMGAEDDGQSVCDRNSRVWGFTNLHVAGNGLIPTVTATNPTLYSVALALLGAKDLVARTKAA